MPYTARGNRMNFPLPQDTGWPVFDKVAKKYRKLLTDERVCQQRIRTLEEQREGAIRRDQHAMAQQLKEGKKATPDSSALDNVEREIADTRRELAAYEEAIDNIEEELVQVLDEHKAAWLAEIQPKLQVACEEYSDAIDDLEKARWSVMQQYAMISFLSSGLDGKGYRTVDARIAGLRAPHGDPYHWKQVLDALRADAAPPEPPREAVPGKLPANEAIRGGKRELGEASLMRDEGTDLEAVVTPAGVFFPS